MGYPITIQGPAGRQKLSVIPVRPEPRAAGLISPALKEGKIVFQSCFMLTTIHPLATASLRMSGRGDPLLYIAAEFVGCHAGVGGGHDRQHALLAARRDALRIT